jgi:hypothetical protein
LQVAVLELYSPIRFEEHSEEAIAHLFTAVFRQWEWWKDRIEFTSADQVEMGKLSMSSLMFMQAIIQRMEILKRKAVGRHLSVFLEPLEKLPNFMRCQIFEWISNTSQDHRKEHDWGRELPSLVSQLRTGQGSTITMDRFPNQPHHQHQS